MDAATFAICHCDGPAVEQPTLCVRCGFTRFPPQEAAAAEVAAAPAAAAAAPEKASEPEQPIGWAFAKQVEEAERAAGETAAPVAPTAPAALVAPVAPAAPAAPVARAAPVAPARRAAPVAPAKRAVRAAPAAPVAPQEPVAAPVAPAAPADGTRTRVVGHSVGTRSLWQSLHLSGRDGAHCAFVLGAYVLLSMVFLAIGYRPMGPKAWAISTFVVLQGLAALLVGAAHYVNRRGLVAETERALLWIAAPLLTCVAFNASVVTMHTTVGGVVATLFVVASGFLLHRKLALELGPGPGRALLVAATGLLATTGLAPLLGAFPPLVACAVAVLLWTGRVFVTKRADATAGEEEDASSRNGMVLEISALLLLAAFTATLSLTRGARYYGAAALPVWGMFLSSLVLVCKGWCASEEAVLPDRVRRYLDLSVDLGLLAGFALTCGDPVGMLVTGALSGATLLRGSLRRQKPLLVLPALAVFVAIYSWLPDPFTVGAHTLRSVLPTRIAAATGASQWSAYALYFAPWAIAMVGAYTWLARRGHSTHALFTGIWAALASGATCAGLILGANRHPAMGVALAVVGAAIGASGVLTGRLLVVAAGSAGLLYGVGAAVLAAGLPYVAAQAALALTVVVALVALGVVARSASASVATAVRRWVDAATLFALTAIPVGLMPYRFHLPTEPLAIANELVLGVLVFVLAAAWRRRELTLGAAALFGRSCLALIALRAPGISTAHALQSFAAASALPIVLWMALASLRLERRVDPGFRPGVIGTLLPVLAIQGFGAAEFGRGLIGLQHDVPALVITGVAILTPIAAAIVAGIKLGVVRRSGFAPAGS